MELVPTIFSTGWASGVNAYATVLLLGLLGRAGVGDVPDELTGDTVIIGALVMYVVEFVVDKVPYLDTTWDMISTAVRPAIGSALGVQFADQDTANAVLGGIGGGGTALASHGVKSSLRLVVNTSPEPLSNIIISLLEDFAVAGVVVLAVEHPVPAAIIAALLLAAGVALVFLLFKLIRRAYGRWNEHRTNRKRHPLEGSARGGRPSLPAKIQSSKSA